MEKKLDLRIEKTYRSLHLAFTELLEEKRVEEITVGELCDRAVIRRTTFYKHFADKYEYFSFYIKETSRSFQRQLDPKLCEQDINSYFIQMCKSLLIFLRSHQRIIENQTQSNLYALLFDALVTHIAHDAFEVLRKTSDYKNVDAAYLEGLSACYAGALMNLLGSRLKKKQPLDEALIIRIISDLLLKQS